MVPLELTTPLTDGAVRVDQIVPAGRHVRGPGEDVRAGEVVLDVGVRLGPRTLSAAAAAGCALLACVRRPWVGVVATGDELVAPGGPLRRGQVYESNGTFLAGATARDGGVPLVAGTTGEADAETKCSKVSKYTKWYFYDSELDSLDFVLCLKEYGVN